MEAFIQTISVLNSVGALLGHLLGEVSSSTPLFSVQGTTCTGATCPGSFFTAIATAWANIGYMTHADMLELINETGFSAWGPLLYAVAAIAAFVGVATNTPLRNYTWFFLGPAFFTFLAGTTTQVRGVNWVIATKPVEDMSDVWRIAETGLANTRLAFVKKKVTIMGKDGPNGAYKVAYPMVMLDSLFSGTTNHLVEFTGIANESAGSGNTNLASSSSGGGNNRWYLLSSLKWPMMENIVGNTFRDPGLRDALVTFLSSECGDLFKDGIKSAAYIAATQARGDQNVTSVMYNKDYTGFQQKLDSVAIPTPRALASLFRAKDDEGSIKRFTQKLSGNAALEAGRGQGIVCSEYLWTLIQGMRWEAGHAYYQLVRSAPRGFSEDQFINTLFYGWDIKWPGASKPDKDAQISYVKHLILAYILRNELLYAPQITNVDQRHAPSEQSKSYGDAYVRTSGSKMKYAELYNAAVMMPYIQGILAYIIIAAYPIASMLIILPGHYKGFFTWVAFFAWIKLWDVGFAMVQVIERSVWAMLGNNTNMGGTAQSILDTVRKVGGIGVGESKSAGEGAPGFVGPPRPAELDGLATWNPIPDVCSVSSGTGTQYCSGVGADQPQAQAWELLDKMLVVSANADLDSANGWYIYIMSALYLAVPMVTGQLVLGAKAGMAGVAKDAFQGIGNDAGGAARTGYQHQAVAAAQTNQASLGQAALAKALRQGTGKDGQGRSLVGQMYDYGNKASELGVEQARLDNTAKALSGAANSAGTALNSYDRAIALAKTDKDLAKSLAELHPGFKLAQGDGKGGSEKTGLGKGVNIAENFMDHAAAAGKVQMGRHADHRSVMATGLGQHMGWESSGKGISSKGYQDYSQKLGHQASFEAESAVWEAKNAFASHVSSAAGIAGMNAGNLSPGHKPSDQTGMAMTGMLDARATKRNADGSIEQGAGGWFSTQTTANGDVYGGASYGGFQLQDSAKKMQIDGQRDFGFQYTTKPFYDFGPMSAAGAVKVATQATTPGLGLGANTTHSNLDKEYSAGALDAARAADLPVTNDQAKIKGIPGNVLPSPFYEVQNQPAPTSPKFRPVESKK